MKAIVSEKGQVTIPKALRDRLGIRPGQVLDFEAQEGHLVASKASEADPVDALFGVLKGQPSTDELLVAMRGDRDAT
jgi:AbrB family looped-hinge helix DNA binding protein